MAIIDIQIGEAGLDGVKPRFVYINTNSTVAEVTVTGFLNKAYAQGFTFQETDKALVSTKATPNASSTDVNLFDVSFDSGDWSLSLSDSVLALDDGDIFVGSAGGLATGVTMSGDATINNAGAITISDESITSSKLDPVVFQHAKVDISLAEFIGSNTASVEILPAPGNSNLKIILHRATLWVDYGGVVLADGGTVQLQYANDANAGGTFASSTIAAADLIAATADTSFGFSPVDTSLPDSTTKNEGIYLSTATADFTGGGGSVYEVDIWYSVVDLTDIS